MGGTGTQNDEEVDSSSSTSRAPQKLTIDVTPPSFDNWFSSCYNLNVVEEDENINLQEEQEEHEEQKCPRCGSEDIDTVLHECNSCGFWLI